MPDTGTRTNGTATALNPLIAPAGNPVTATKAALGKVLFWDEQLASTRTVACGTCHIARGGGSDPRALSSNANARHPGADVTFGTADDIQGSPGVPLAQGTGSYVFSNAFGLREQVTKRRSMPHVNSAYPNLLFWEGRASDTFRDPLTGAVVLASGGALESQSLEPPVSDVEMGHTARNWSDVAARVAVVIIPTYQHRHQRIASFPIRADQFLHMPYIKVPPFAIGHRAILVETPRVRLFRFPSNVPQTSSFNSITTVAV